jgi:Fic family protein
MLRHSDAPDYEESALRFSLKCHADFVKIHPFEDGNGRTSRLLLSILLVRLGLRPIPIEAPKREYTDALNYYFMKLDTGRLFELYLRLA